MSRRAGGTVYIEIFLGFDGSRKMQDVQASIDRLNISLEQKIRGSSVTIIPSGSPVP